MTAIAELHQWTARVPPTFFPGTHSFPLPSSAQCKPYYFNDSEALNSPLDCNFCKKVFAVLWSYMNNWQQLTTATPAQKLKTVIYHRKRKITEGYTSTKLSKMMCSVFLSVVFFGLWNIYIKWYFLQQKKNSSVFRDFQRYKQQLGCQYQYTAVHNSCFLPSAQFRVWNDASFFRS